MRRSLAALVFVLTAAVGTFAVPAPARAAQTSDAKVVIIVGATHSATTKYRGYADLAYAEAIKYTPNVVKVYSPNATWSKVKSATVGASGTRPRSRRNDVRGSVDAARSTSGCPTNCASTPAPR